MLINPAFFNASALPRNVFVANRSVKVHLPAAPVAAALPESKSDTAAIEIMAVTMSNNSTCGVAIFLTTPL
jgi:hypothetical protein